MDTTTVWQWRVKHVNKHLGSPELFHYSNKIGLDFNVDANKQKKIDLQLVTNGALLEVCDFAKTVNKGEKHFITNILENNFDLRLENEKRRTDFTAHIQRKVKELFRNPPGDEHEVFTLFDTKPKSKCTSSNSNNNNNNNELRKETTHHKTETHEGEHEDKFMSSRVKSTECVKTEREPGGMDVPQSTKDVKDVLPPLFPYCEGIGLRLDIGSEQKLDPGLLTNFIMLELVQFTGTLTASYSRIILDVLQHNFDLDLKNPLLKKRVWFQVMHLLKRRKQLSRCKTSPGFKDEPFSFHTNPIKRPSGSALSSMKVKRLKTGQSKENETNTISHQFTDSANRDGSQNTTDSDIPKESESTSRDVGASFTTTDIPLRPPMVNSNMDQSFRRVLELQQKQSPGNAIHKFDMEQEETVNLWKLRANRVKQILPALNKEFSRFKWFKEFPLEFNIGFGPKQKISVDALVDCVLLKIAKLALAMSSSQQEFILEILEYNFDFSPRSQYDRNIFALEIMNRVRQLKSCDGADKIANEVFELPGLTPSINRANQIVGNVVPEVRNILSVEKNETKEHIPSRSDNLYPCCAEIGLKLQVKKTQSNQKLEVDKLTNAAMMELTDFAEKLCGTFERICLDIIRHNFDLDSQSGESEGATDILARIPAAMEQKNLSRCVKFYNKRRCTRKNVATVDQLECQNNQNVVEHSAVSSRAADVEQNIDFSLDTEYEDELDSKLWKLRAKHIQQILRIPHEEHCPLYSYSRCRKLGIHFNVGSGVKQNLDPRLLTNGIMVEFNTFSAALVSARQDFVTEILEYNIDLNFKNELYRSAFGHQTVQKIRVMNYHKKSSSLRMNMVFELPDMMCLQELSHCPKCYQARNHKLHRDEPDTKTMHHPRPSAMTDPFTPDGNCTERKPATNPYSPFSRIEESIMESYPLCKSIGLSLCVDKKQRKDKLDPRVLTLGIMNEVLSFAKKLCGTKTKIVHTLLEHTFNIGKQSQDIDLMHMFRKAIAQNDGGLEWFGEVFAIRPVSRRQRNARKLKEASAMQRNEKKEIIKKRKLALLRKQETGPLQNHSVSVVKSSYHVCTEIGLDLDVTTKSAVKEKLDLKLLTRAVVFEIHKFATQKVGHYYPRTVFDILDYNFDLSSQHYRRCEFSLATASKIQTVVKQYCKKFDGADKVFKLPFLFYAEDSETVLEKRQIDEGAHSTLDTTSSSESRSLSICTAPLTSAAVSSILTNENSHIYLPFEGQPDKRGQSEDEENTQIPRNVPNVCEVDQGETGTVNYYTCPLGESDLDSDEVTDSENNGNEDNLQNAKGCSLKSDLRRESESSCLSDFANCLTANDVSFSLPGGNPNMDSPFSSHFDDKELCGGEEQMRTPRYAPIDCDLEQDKVGTENLWKLRANRVEQILSALNKEFGSFNRSKKVGLEFNVGYGPKQNVSVESLTNSLLLEIARFAVAINSSQKDFITQILEYNFELGLQSQHDRNIFIGELMNRVRQLKSCDDAAKLPNEIFELPVPNPSSVILEISSGIKIEKDDVATTSPLNASTQDCTSFCIYPCCQEIGLRLHVNNSQTRKKLEINKLTNGAMAEVETFAEKLCGSFDQICLDILRHNLGCDLQNGDSDLASNVFAQIPAAIEQRNLSTNVKACKKIKGTRKDCSTIETLDSLNNPDLDASSAGSCRDSLIDQNGRSSVDIQRKNELSLKLWKLRANHIQRILSIPHEEHCPLYSYSRCKRLGIDFNVGFGKKQNLDPKLLTNGVMVEFNTFATALVSAKKHFVTEILEYNFNLSLKNELYRSAFGQQTLEKYKTVKSNSVLQKKMLFELPDLTRLQQPTHDKTTYCPKCYQERKRKVCHDDYYVGRKYQPYSHTVTDNVSADANLTAQNPSTNPSSTLSVIEETIMDSYPRCKKIGLNLCVDLNKPKDKLDRDYLTRGVMNEVVNFANKLCGTKSKIIRTLLEHNFNIGKQVRDIDFAQMFRRETARKDGGISWFSEAFVIRQVSRRQPGHESKVKEASAMPTSERMETIKKRKLALQMKEVSAALPSNCASAKKPHANRQSEEKRFRYCTRIGLDLDLKSKTGGKEKLDFNLLTTAAVFEIHKFAIHKVGQSYSQTVFDILDYNFDLSSQHHRCCEFSMLTASKIQTVVKRYRLKRVKFDKVFKLPFASPSNTSPGLAGRRKQKKFKMYRQEKRGRKRNEGRCVHQVRYCVDGNHVFFFGAVRTDEQSRTRDKDIRTQINPLNVQMDGSLMSVNGHNPLFRNVQIKEEEYDPYYWGMTPEQDAEEPYHSHYDAVKTESKNWNGLVERLIIGEPEGPFGYSFSTTYPNFESNIKTDSQNEGVQYYMLSESQRSEGHALLSPCSNLKREMDSAVGYLDPAEEAVSHEYSIITIGEGDDSTLIKEEQENELADSYYDEGVLYAEGEEGYHTGMHHDASYF